MRLVLLLIHQGFLFPAAPWFNCYGINFAAWALIIGCSFLLFSLSFPKAVFIGVEILKQAIEEIRKDFHVSIGCVSGNESRANQELGFVEAVASDNYDNTIFNIL